MFKIDMENDGSYTVSHIYVSDGVLLGSVLQYGSDIESVADGLDCVAQGQTDRQLAGVFA